MKTYTNHRFVLVEDDNDIVSTTNRTDTVCGMLTIMAMLLIGILITIIGGLL